MVSPGSIDILTSTSQIVARPERSVTDNEDREDVSIVNAMANGDTVEISQAARESYAAVQETGVAGEVGNDAGSGGDFTTTGDGIAATSGETSGAGAGGGATGSSTETEAESSDSDVEELEEEITGLRQEIASLLAEQSGDESKQAELSAKQAELAGLLAELALMQAG